MLNCTISGVQCVGPLERSISRMTSMTTINNKVSVSTSGLTEIPFFSRLYKSGKCFGLYSVTGSLAGPETTCSHCHHHNNDSLHVHSIPPPSPPLSGGPIVSYVNALRWHEMQRIGPMTPHLHNNILSTSFLRTKTRPGPTLCRKEIWVCCLPLGS